jgi:hypothetical protein
MINCSIYCSLTIGQYVFEASFWLRDWAIFAETHMGSAVKVLQVGPFVFSSTNLKRLKELHQGKAEPMSFDELIEEKST